MENSAIEWTHHTFNPWIGCTKVHAGCDLCYAETLMDKRYSKVQWGPHGTRVRTTESYWRKPLAWDRAAAEAGERHRVFCASLADVFEDWRGPMKNAKGDDLARCERKECGREVWIPKGTHYAQHPCDHCGGSVYPRTMDDVRADLFRLIDQTPNLDWLLLTKRPQNIVRMWPMDDGQPTPIFPGMPGPLGEPAPCKIRRHRPNVWLGTSVSNQASADAQIPHLVACRDLSPVLFLSIEPLLAPIDLNCNLPLERVVRWHRPMAGLVDWVIVGGESGIGARPTHMYWPQQIRAACENAGTPFFMKQWGEWAPYAEVGLGNLSDRQIIGDSVVWMGMDGRVSSEQTRPANFDDGTILMARVGKKAAGHLIHGTEYRQFPQPAEVPCGT